MDSIPLWFYLRFIMIGPIHLTEDEGRAAALIAQSQEEILRTHDPDRYIRVGKEAHHLFRKLSAKNVIPVVRLRYFADPDYKVGNTRGSRRDVFLRNAGSEESMYTHPHFWRYLLYFIYGPKIPKETQERFLAARKDSFREWDSLRKLARKEARSLDMERTEKAEAFFQLALDCDCELAEALHVRDAVLKAR